MSTGATRPLLAHQRATRYALVTGRGTSKRRKSSGPEPTITAQDDSDFIPGDGAVKEEDKVEECVPDDFIDLEEKELQEIKSDLVDADTSQIEVRSKFHVRNWKNIDFGRDRPTVYDSYWVS